MSGWKVRAVRSLMYDGTVVQALYEDDKGQHAGEVLPGGRLRYMLNTRSPDEAVEVPTLLVLPDAFAADLYRELAWSFGGLHPDAEARALRESLDVERRRVDLVLGKALDR